jgi:O-antigen ligase
MTLCVPFSIWPGNAFFTISDKFSKGVVMAMMISMAIVTLKELRRLLWIQVSAVALVTFFSIALRHYNLEGRLSGIQEAILYNPNDLAINIAISFPLGMAFMLRSRGARKVVWALSLVVMALGVVLTASRSGLVALVLIFIVCIWEYGIKEKRRQLVVGAALCLLLGLGIAMSNSQYRARVVSIISGHVEGDRSGTESLEARKALLRQSIMTAVRHPIFGVGPGCFYIVSGDWHVAHNAYTELAAETGFPGIILFLLAMASTFKNIRYIRTSPQYRDDPEFRLFTQALWAGMVGYLAGSCTSSTEYNLYPYFMIGYTCAMMRIIGLSQPAPDEKQAGSGLTKLSYASGRKFETGWSR